MWKLKPNIDLIMHDLKAAFISSFIEPRKVESVDMMFPNPRVHSKAQTVAKTMRTFYFDFFAANPTKFLKKQERIRNVFYDLMINYFAETV